MTEADLKDFLEANKADIQDAVKQRMIAKLLEEHRWNIGEAVNKCVREFVDQHVVPAVAAELESQKGSIIAATLHALATVSDELAKGLAADAAKNIGSEWKRREIVKSIFGC